MVQFRFRILTTAEPPDAWTVVGDVGGLDRWVPGVVECRLDGERRACTFADGRVQQERVLDLDHDGRCYRYETDSGLPGVENRGAFRVKPAPGGGSIVEWDADVQVDDPATAAHLLPLLDAGYADAAASLALALARSGG